MSRVDTFVDPFLKEWPRSGKVVILDLEYTSWEGSMIRNWSADWEFREIVQIGGIRLDVNPQEFIEEEKFERTVKPFKNPHLSDYFSNLTGISNTLVAKRGCHFKDAFDDFFHFFSGSNEIWSIGCDGEVLRENAVLNQIPYPFHKSQILNIRPALARILDVPENQIMSCKLPEMLGLPPSRNGHSALDDAISIYKSVNHLRKKGLL